jgi:hypothetical protein
LVPLLEAASNEDIEDAYMINKWATLLASAATDDGIEPRFIAILKELRGKQALLLEQIALNNWEAHEYPLQALEHAPRVLSSKNLKETLHEALFGGKTLDWVAVHDEVLGHINRPGAAIIHFMHSYEGESHIPPPLFQPFNESNELDLDILASLGVCRRTDEVYGAFGRKYVCNAVYYYITELGLAFLKQVSPDIFKKEGKADPV